MARRAALVLAVLCAAAKARHLSTTGGFAARDVPLPRVTLPESTCVSTVGGDPSARGGGDEQGLRANARPLGVGRSLQTVVLPTTLVAPSLSSADYPRAYRFGTDLTVTSDGLVAFATAYSNSTTTVLRVFPFTRATRTAPWSAAPSLDVTDPLAVRSFTFGQRALVASSDGFVLCAAVPLAFGAGNASLPQAGRVFTWFRSSPTTWAPAPALEFPGGPLAFTQVRWRRVGRSCVLMSQH